jgi:hypothetical protein
MFVKSKSLCVSVGYWLTLGAILIWFLLWLVPLMVCDALIAVCLRAMSWWCELFEAIYKAKLQHQFIVQKGTSQNGPT